MELITGVRKEINSKIPYNILVCHKLWNFTTYSIKNIFRYFFRKAVQVKESRKELLACLTENSRGGRALLKKCRKDSLGTVGVDDSNEKVLSNIVPNSIGAVPIYLKLTFGHKGG